MVERFFCADNSRKFNEDIIGTASIYKTFILIECPTPWTKNAFYSKLIPENLTNLIEKMKKEDINTRFLLIHNNLYHSQNSTKVIIYKKKEGLIKNFIKTEFNLLNIKEVVPTINNFLLNGKNNFETIKNNTRDIAVCNCIRYEHRYY